MGKFADRFTKRFENITDRARLTRSDETEEEASSEQPVEPATRDRKAGRNDPCPCGSGKKYKKCCGAKG
jgi:preprotein translocase subunit SecA